MKIVIVCDYGEVNGGAAQVAITSARGLAEAGIEVIFVCGIRPISALLDHPRIELRCLELDSVWERRNPAGAAFQAIWNRRARRALETILEPLPRDETIVHFHQWTKALSPSVLAAPLRHALSSVVSLHDYFLACPNGAYYRFPQARPCALTPLSPACVATACDRSSYAHKLIRVLRQWMTRRAVARNGAALGILSVSPFAARIVEPFVPAIHPRFVLRSPVEIAQEAPVPVSKNRDFVFVGRLTEEKGVRLLAEVAREADLPLTIVGDGPLLPELRRLGGRIRCTGWLTGEAVAELMQTARALIFPSTWYETGGLVVLEALARGVPVIVSRVTAPADLIIDGVNGYVVGPDDRAALRARLLNLVDDEVAATMGAEAHSRYWADPPTPQIQTAKLLDIYRAILSRRRTAAGGGEAS